MYLDRISGWTVVRVFRRTVETLWARRSGLGRAEGDRVCSPYFNSLGLAQDQSISTHQSIFSIVVMISPRTASTPASISYMRMLETRLA